MKKIRCVAWRIGFALVHLKDPFESVIKAFWVVEERRSATNYYHKRSVFPFAFSLKNSRSTSRVVSAQFGT
ncbi:hypothetical protein T02_12708 [Trichinella nativa]|uniref:Uncharacterized protein n=1 Tax=Trichinella nativa TaxID=6335 RepID=A0A0V1KZW9_9BILA|nr:hypothetical protein T02_12708 [Trichinella nativa]